MSLLVIVRLALYYHLIPQVSRQMPRGRPPLDPQTRLERRKDSIERYQANNRDKLREAARVRMRSRRATIADYDFRTNLEHRQRVAANSEAYRQRKREEERKQLLPQRTEKKRARKLEQDVLRASHTQGSKTSRKPLASAPAPKKPQKARGLAPSMPVIGLARSSSPLSRRKPSQGHVPASTVDNLTSTSNRDEDEDEPRRFVYHDEPVFPRRVQPARKACAGCHMEDCIGCACYAMNPPLDRPSRRRGPFFPGLQVRGHGLPRVRMCLQEIDGVGGARWTFENSTQGFHLLSS
ncbi:hypothetical protein K438DRAFT_1772591 [Mycena galopus ATCC 62051]|nr:hypothetical protein K438DRAFT_1772591 [Mycena galopus ATCC 62051]